MDKDYIIDSSLVISEEYAYDGTLPLYVTEPKLDADIKKVLKQQAICSIMSKLKLKKQLDIRKIKHSNKKKKRAYLPPKVWYARLKVSKQYKRTYIKHIYTTVQVAKVFVKLTRNNTHVSVITLDKNNIKRTIICSSGMLLGIKGTKRSTPLATEIVVKRAMYILKKLNKRARVLYVYRSGAGRGRYIVMKALKASRLKLGMLRDVTPIPHNGTRLRSKRRV